MKRIAYFLSTFPTVSTTFIQREVRAIEGAGIKLDFVSTKKPKEGGFHPQDKDLWLRTFFLDKSNPAFYLIGALYFLICHPVKTARTVFLALSLNDEFPYQRIKNLIHVAVAMRLGLWTCMNRIEALHVHFAFGAAAIAIFHKSLTSIPYTLSIHGSDVLLKRPLTRAKLLQAEQVISNCEFHIQNLTKKFPELSKDKFRLLHISLDLKSPSWNPAPWNTQLPEKLHILHIGRLVEVKAQHLLIDACKMLKDKKRNFELHIVGDGPLHKQLAQQVESLGLSKEVKLLGKKFETEIHEEFAWCDVVVLSSLSEGTPMTFIEAMAKGRPIVGPNITAIPEMIDEAKNGYVFPLANVPELTLALEKFFIPASEIMQMGQYARVKAEKEYDITNNIGTLIQVFTNHH